VVGEQGSARAPPNNTPVDGSADEIFQRLTLSAVAHDGYFDTFTGRRDVVKFL
jgi:hypothetical protein